MKKIYAINGSPRKNGNTAQQVLELKSVKLNSTPNSPKPLKWAKRCLLNIYNIIIWVLWLITKALEQFVPMRAGTLLEN